MELTCRECGKPFEQKPRGRKRASCSDLCKNTYNKRAKRLRSFMAAVFPK